MNSFHEQYKNQIQQLADRMRNEQLPPLTEELFSLFETTGNRLKYEDIYFKRRKFLAVFGLAAYIFKRREDVVKLEEVLREICEEECWALPAHVNRKENMNWHISVDLFASETAQALAEIITLINGELPEESKLNEELCKRVRSEILQRVLVPFEKNPQGWECSDHNWNAVCCGSIGSAALYLLAETEKERLEPLLERICHSLTFYLAGFREDGACMEGIGYFTYGMTYFVGFAEQLLRYSNGERNLFDNDKVRKIAEFQQKNYFGSGQTVSFSDGDAQAKFRMGLTVFLARQYDTVQIPDAGFACDFETDPCYRFMGLMRDYLWTKDLTAIPGGSLKRERHDCLPKAQWSICESSSDAGFAIKGGSNGEPHNHNDVGGFLYVLGEEQLFCDLGAGEYTGAYFGPGRYEILCNSSEGHSVPMINGKFQKAGPQYKASRFEADGNGETIIEFSGAYEEPTLERLLRKTNFSLETGCLQVEDRFEVNVWQLSELPKNYFTENLVTKGDVTVQGREVTIQGRTAACRIRIEGSAEHLRIVEKHHSNHEGKQERIRLIQWEVLPEKEEKGTRYHGVSKYTIWQCRTKLS